jgi:hypothetical protein
MNELDPSKMSEEDLKNFMQSSPSREEVNKYLNNMFMSVNNSFGIFQGYMIASIGLTLKEYFEQTNVHFELEDFMKRFFEHNKKVIEQALEASKSNAAAEDAEDASTSKEVDISMF